MMYFSLDNFTWFDTMFSSRLMVGAVQNTTLDPTGLKYFLSCLQKTFRNNLFNFKLTKLQVISMGVLRLFSSRGQNFQGGGCVAKIYNLPKKHQNRYYFCPPLRTSFEYEQNQGTLNRGSVD